MQGQGNVSITGTVSMEGGVLLDILKEGILWKLKKPLHGLDDTSRKFWLMV